MRHSEQTIQQSVVIYLRTAYPRALFCASAGGMRTSMATARKMKAAGYRKGFPDLFVYEPRGLYHGLAIELKSEKGRPSPEQIAWQKELMERGYMAVICRGVDSAIDELDHYMSLPKKQYLP